MRSVLAKDGQNLMDIAIQAVGHVDAAFALARLNDLSVTDVLASGQLINLPDVNDDNSVVNEFTTRKWMPATADKPGENILGGIGYMGINIDFKVS